MSYFESRMPIDPSNFKLLEEKIEFIKKLGIKNLIIEFKEEIENIPENVKSKINRLENINIFYRVNLNPKNNREFLDKIRNFKNYPHIISVESINKKVQISAAKDSRVDIISYSDINILKSLSVGVISLTKQNNSFIEFSLSPIMEENKIRQSKNFRALYKFLGRALEKKANILISGNFSNPYHFRNPKNLIFICNTLLEIPINQTKKIFRENVIKLLERIKKPLPRE